MIDFLRSWVFNIVTLVILIVLLEILLPTGKIKKFINLISGFILIIAIINPFLNYFATGVDLRELQIRDAGFMDKKEIAAAGKLMKEQQMVLVTEVYRKKLIRQIEEALKGTEDVSDVKADVIINEDHTSGNFGEIKRVYLNITKGGKSAEIEPVIRVRKVRIGPRGKDDEEGKNEVGSVFDRELEKKLADKVNKMLDVKHENIVVSIGKG